MLYNIFMVAQWVCIVSNDKHLSRGRAERSGATFHQRKHHNKRKIDYLCYNKRILT